jgi:hypothetical protein
LENTIPKMVTVSATIGATKSEQARTAFLVPGIQESCGSHDRCEGAAEGEDDLVDPREALKARYMAANKRNDKRGEIESEGAAPERAGTKARVSSVPLSHPSTFIW